jgi:hypothetical protein
LAECLVRPGKIDSNALTAVIEEKRSYIRSKGILEFIPLQSGLESVGGLSNLKQWVKLRLHSFTVDTPQPKGVGILNSATDLKIDYPYGIT